MTFNRKKLLFCCRLGIAVAILAIIFSRVDTTRVLSCLTRIRINYALLSLLFGYLFPILILSWRWQLALRVLYGIGVPYRLLLRHYWTGMFVGYFFPGGIGTDVYRAARMTAEPGGFKVNAAAIVGERVFAVLATALLLVVSYPPVSTRLVTEPQLTRIVRVIYFLSISAVAGLGMLALLNSSLGARLRRFVQRRIGLEINRVVHKIDRRSVFANGKADAWELVTPFFIWRNQLMIIVLTILSQIVASVGGRFLLLSININLPLITHIFAWTLMCFFFLLPISVGAFGIREAAFIVIFGLFGVSREDALASSFISLASGLIAVGMGGLIWLNEGLKRSKSAANGNA